jgi:NADPH-dependent 2,4-dienoyl-CoA reductase/sulfur reductase-like enzyme/nitrite reductase/ring-hydroxylating ferredoxin subunit
MSTIRFQLQDIPDGGMTSFHQDEQIILVTRDGDQVTAMQGKCPHAGADLGEGLRCDNRIICPWHHATFDAQSGELLEPLAMNGLERYEIEEDAANPDNKIIHFDKPIKFKDPDSQQQDSHTLIVGGGGAGFMAATHLRAQGYAGKITMISADDHAPYNRPLLSKMYLAGNIEEGKLLLGGSSWAEENSVDLQINTKANEINPETKQVTLDNGEQLSADYLIVATGAAPQRPPIEGVELEGVYVMHSFSDAQAIAEAVDNKKVVIIGTGFIGMEAAASLTQRNTTASITVIGMSDSVMDNIISPQVGAGLQQLHESNGVVFQMGATVSEIVGSAGKVTGVTLSSGKTIDADVVIMGTGVKPRVEVIETAKKDSKDGVNVSANLLLEQGAYALGDIANANSVLGKLRIEHWRVALQHGMIAAENILKQGNDDIEVRPFDERVPFFWTQQFGKSLRYIGHAETTEHAILRGNPNELNYVEFYFNDDSDNAKVVAASGLAHDKDIIAIGELIRLGNSPSRAQIMDGLDVVQHLQDIA